MIDNYLILKELIDSLKYFVKGIQFIHPLPKRL